VGIQTPWRRRAPNAKIWLKVLQLIATTDFHLIPIQGHSSWESSERSEMGCTRDFERIVRGGAIGKWHNAMEFMEKGLDTSRALISLLA
jgi:hypothetical protein